MTIENSNDLSRRSYGWGWLVFGYGVIWSLAPLAGYTLLNPLLGRGDSSGVILLYAATAAALAGGLGGTMAMFQRAASSLSAPSGSARPALFTYLLQPLAGLIAGMLSLFLIALPGALLVNYATTRTLALADLAATSTFVALYLLLAWIAGCYQQAALAKIRPARSSSESKALTVPGDPLSSALAPAGIDPDAPFAFKAWFKQRQRLTYWSRTWGLFILFYGLVWLTGLLASLLWSGSLFPAESHSNPPLLNLLAAGWPAALAGGIGGVIGMLYDLYRHISLERDFEPRHPLAYLVLPLTGLVFGGVMYLFIASGYLSYQSLVSQAPAVVDSPMVMTIYLVLGWVAGFRQQSLHGLIWRIIQAVVRFFRAVLSVLSPKLLWDQARRTDALSEIAQQRELFRPVERNTVKRKT